MKTRREDGFGSSRKSLRARFASWRQPAGWNDLVGAVGLVCFVAAVGLFAYLAVTVPAGRHQALEHSILAAFRNSQTGNPLGPGWLPQAIRDVTALGSAMVITLLTLLILGYLLLTRRFGTALLLVAAMAGGQAVGATLKHGFARGRPELSLHLVQVHSASFPSGHSMASSIFYLTMGALLTQTAKRRREKIYVIASALLITALIGFSRVYLGVHYPTDVLAGWCAGAAWALICGAVARRLRRRGKLEPAPA